MNRSALHAPAKVRKELKAACPPLPKGRPSKARRRQAQHAKRVQRRVAELFEHR